MSNEPLEPVPATTEAPVQLQELAQLIRSGRPLNSELRQRLADLVSDLGRDLESAPLPPAESRHLSEAVTQLVHSLQQPADHGLLGPARERLQQALTRVEAQAPTTTRLAGQLMDILANLGI